MIDVVEEGVNVGVHDPVEALAAELVDAVDSLFYGPALAEGVATLLEFRFEDLPSHQMNGGLEAGWSGRWRSRGDLAPFAGLLRMAEVLHVGKGAVFGLGRVAVG